MTSSGSSLYPDDGKKVAQKDWRRITVLLEQEDAEGAASFLQ